MKRKLPKKIISLVLSFCLIFGIVSTVSGNVTRENATLKVGQWLSIVDSEFGMTYFEQTEPYIESVQKDNTYFSAVQTAFEWGVIKADEQLDVLASVTADFMAATLVRAAKLKGDNATPIKNADKIRFADEVAIAAANGVITLKGGKLDNRKVTLEDGQIALAIAKDLWSSKKFDEQKALVKPNENVKDLSSSKSFEVEKKFSETVTVIDEVTGMPTEKVVEKEIIAVPATAEAEALVENNIIVLPATEENPFGSLRKVTDVEKSDDQIQLECMQAELSEVFDSIDYQSSFQPDFQTAQVIDATGDVLNKTDLEATDGFSLANSGVGTLSDEATMLSLLKDEPLTKNCTNITKKPININFSVNGYSVSGKIDGDKMDFSVSAVIKGVKVTKTYNLTNFNLSSKADVNLLKAQINEAYIRVDYDLADSTKIEGNYNKTIADYNWGEDLTLDEADALSGLGVHQKLQNAVDKVTNSISNTFKIASINVPIPNFPIISIGLDINLRFNMDGTIELVVESNQARGYEIINNQGRFISDTTYTKTTLNLSADAQLTVNFSLALKFFGLNLVDAAIETGIGLDSDAKISFYNKTTAKLVLDVTADIPFELAVAMTDNDPYMTVSAHVKIYGILIGSVGENSPILKLIGLNRTWNIYGPDNAVIYEYDYQNDKIPLPTVGTTEATTKEATSGETTTASPSTTAPATTAKAATEFKPAANAPSAEITNTFVVEAGKTLNVAKESAVWTSSNSAVAAVSTDGIVTGVSGGTAIITGTLTDGSAISYQITVNELTVPTTTNSSVRSAYQPVTFFAA
ncbi:MAG: Ig-like domain-containing protein [Oscillospiraceae bacterium]